MRSSAFLFLLTLPLAAQQTSLLEREPGGWTSLLPPADLKGWTRIPIPSISPLKERQQWSVDAATGVLLCSGDGGHEWLRSDREFANFVLHVEWRFTPRQGDARYNSGVGVRLSPWGELWHQAQTGPAGAWLFGVDFKDGALVRSNFRDQMKENRVKPAGEWNVMEVTAAGDKLSLWLNGATVSEWSGVLLKKGAIAFEAEGFEIGFRRIMLRELPN